MTSTVHTVTRFIKVSGHFQDNYKNLKDFCCVKTTILYRRTPHIWFRHNRLLRITYTVNCGVFHHNPFQTQYLPWKFNSVLQNSLRLDLDRGRRLTQSIGTYTLIPVFVLSGFFTSVGYRFCTICKMVILLLWLSKYFLFQPQHGL